MDDVKQKDLPKVSVIIPMRNEEKYIGKCLQSVIDQDYPRNLVEILVIDGMSDDGSRKIVSNFSQRYSNIKLIDNPEVATVCALNKGISESKGSIIIRVDAHCYIKSDYILQCVSALMQTGADNVGGLMRPIGMDFIGKAVAFAMSSPFGMGSGRFHYAEKEIFVDTVYLGCYRRKVFNKIGMYDEQLHYSEDDELNYRLIKDGGKIFLTPKIKSHYYCRSSLSSLWRQYYNYGYGKVRTLKKHKGLPSWRHVAPPTFVLSIIGSSVLWVVNSIFGWLLLAVSSGYLGLSITTSFKISFQKGWRYFLVLPITFGVIHFSYGIGFLYGILNLISFQRTAKDLKKSKFLFI